MKKIIISSFLFFSLAEAQSFLANPFLDMSPRSLEGEAAIALYHEAVLGGFADGEFKPDQGLNRAEAMKFLLRARGNFEPEYYSNPFEDVNEEEWYAPYILTGNNEGIIQGYPDGLMRPGQLVTTAEFLKMMSLTFDLPLYLRYHYDDAFDSDWFGKYSGAAVKYDLFPNRSQYLFPHQDLTRGEASIAIYQYLKSQDHFRTPSEEAPIDKEEVDDYLPEEATSEPIKRRRSPAY